MGGDGSATVDADYNIASKTLNANVHWERDGLEINLKGNNNDKATEVSATTAQKLNGHDWNIGATYDILKKAITVNNDLTVDGTNVAVEYDNQNKDPVLTVKHKVDDKNTVEPSISLKTGNMAYGWIRKINGGTVESRLTPGQKLDITWEDNGANGVWSTHAEVPLENTKNTKVSFSRDWNY